MKKNILVFVIVFLALSLNAQIQVSSTGYVGVGTSSPTKRLDVYSSNYLQSIIRSSNSSGGVLLQNSYGQKWEIQSVSHYTSTVTDGLIFYDRNVGGYNGYRMVINKSGNVGIGKYSPSYKLDVNGYIRATNVTIPSDSRLKENIKDLTKTDLLSSLRPVEYNYTDELFAMGDFREDSSSDTIIVDETLSDKEKDFIEKSHYGFIAQELQQVFPELVLQDDKGYLSIDYISLIPVMVSAIKEQQVKIEEMQKTIDYLTSKEAILREEIEDVDNINNK